MKNDYKPIKPMKEVPDQLRKLRRQFLRYQQAEIVYSLSHKKLFELASDAGAIYRFDSTARNMGLSTAVARHPRSARIPATSCSAPWKIWTMRETSRARRICSPNGRSALHKQ